MGQRLVLDQDDVKSIASGYHLEVWEMICDTVGINPETHTYVELDVDVIRGEDHEEQHVVEKDEEQPTKYTLEIVPTPHDEWCAYLRLVKAGKVIGFLDINGKVNDIDEVVPQSFDCECQGAIIHRFLFKNCDAEVDIKLIDIMKPEE